MEEIKVEKKEEPKDEAPEMVSQALKAAEALKAENTRMENVLKQLREVEALRALGGRSEGKPQEAPPKVLTPKEYKDQIMRGIV